MAGPTNALRDLMLNAAKGTNPAAFIGYVSAHTADPGTTGTSEVSGGSPAYARKAIAFNAASGGAMDDSTNGASIDVPACTVAYLGLWSAVTAGVFYGSANVTDEVFAAQGVYVVDDFDITIP